MVVVNPEVQIKVNEAKFVFQKVHKIKVHTVSLDTTNALLFSHYFLPLKIFFPQNTLVLGRTKIDN